MLEQHLADLRESAQFMDQARKNSAVKLPWLTFLLASACAVIFLIMGIIHPDTLNRPSPKTLVAWGANYGPLVADGQWWRVLTNGFVHAGFPHMAANVMILLLLGIIVETLQGRWRLAMLFLFSIVTGSLAAIAAHPTTVGVGASGGLFGLMGAWAALIIRFHREFPSGLRKRLAKALAVLLGVNALFSVLPMVDWAAHLGGFIGGLALGLLIVRSPVRVAWPGAWVYPALPALAIATLLFAGYAVARVPLDAPWDPENPKAELRQKLADLEREGELRTLLEDHRRLIAALEAIHGDVHAGKRTREDGLRAFDQTLVRMRDYVRAIEERQGPPATPPAGENGEKLQALRRLIEARLAYASLLREDLERPSESSAALFRAKMNAQQAEVEYTETLLRAEGLDLVRSSTTGAEKRARTSSAPPGQDKETRR